MSLRNLRTRLRDTRSGATTDPLDLTVPGVIQVDQELCRHDTVDLKAGWLDAITPDVDEDTDPGGADLASVDPLPAGAVRNRQNVYVGGNRCAVCHVPAISDVCVKCKLAGHLPPGMDVYVPPGMDRILPDPPLNRVRSNCETIAREIGKAHRMRTIETARPAIERGLGIDLSRLFDDPPLHRLDGAGYVLEPLPDVADFDEARGRLRTEVIGRIGGAA